jgi:hypothetical protein
MELTAEEARRILDYNPETGDLVWKIRLSRVKPGDIAGCARGNGVGKNYRAVRVQREAYLAHRLVWLIVTGEWPVGHIDHHDGDGMNNAWVNLRDVTRQENCKNVRRRIDNTAGATGVSWDQSRNRFSAYIGVDRKVRKLGRFKTFEEAVVARKAAEIEYGYHPNHGQDRPL